MKSILIDTLTYRWKYLNGEYYFGRTLNNDYPKFTASEKGIYLSEFLMSFLVHDQVYIKIDGLEETIDLLGIEPTLNLISEKIIVIIDDEGTHTGFLPNGGNNLLMNFSNCSSLKWDAILHRLEVKYKGHFDSRLLKELVIKAEDSAIKIDGAWLGHLAQEEDMDDLQNSRILSHLRFTQSYDNIIVKDDDVLPLMRLNYLNKSLVYQNELKIDSLLTEAESQVLLNVKITRYADRISEKGVPIFHDILTTKQIPDLTNLYTQGLLTIHDLLTLRNSFEGLLFRKWLQNEGYDKKSIYKTLMSSNPSLNEKILVKLVRWSFPAAVGLQWPGAEIALKAINSLVVDKILRGWHPNFFLDKKVSVHLNKLAAESKMNKKLEREIKAFGKKRTKR